VTIVVMGGMKPVLKTGGKNNSQRNFFGTVTMGSMVITAVESELLCYIRMSTKSYYLQHFTCLVIN